MRPLAPLVLLAAALAGCGAGGGSEARGSVSTVTNPQTGLELGLSFDEPLRTGQALSWRLQVSNRGQEPVTLRFSSGKEGDVALRRGDREVYRWSANRVFSQALREFPLAGRAKHEISLEEPRLGVPAGDYELVAEVAAEPSPGVLHRPVTVR